MTGEEHTPDFFGHPRGLWYLAFTEAWERFSYYGMQALLVLYMVKYLLLPGRIDNVAAPGFIRCLLSSDLSLLRQDFAHRVGFLCRFVTVLLREQELSALQGCAKPNQEAWQRCHHARSRSQSDP